MGERPSQELARMKKRLSMPDEIFGIQFDELVEKVKTMEGNAIKAQKLLREPVKMKRVEAGDPTSLVVHYDYVVDESWLEGWKKRLSSLLVVSGG